jgi:hypothetical protein
MALFVLIDESKIGGYTIECKFYIQYFTKKSYVRLLTESINNNSKKYLLLLLTLFNIVKPNTTAVNHFGLNVRHTGFERGMRVQVPQGG